MAEAQTTVLDLENVRLSWPGDSQACLDIESLSVARGETLFLHGPSGCGKSTLLSLLVGMRLAQQGRVSLLGRAWGGMPPAARDRWRADHVGYIFQQFNLLPYLGMKDNVLLPCRFSEVRRQAAVEAWRDRDGQGRRVEAAHGKQETQEEGEAAHWLVAMGLDRSLWKQPAHTLSVGQQQRVAAARALMGKPALVVADEPTSALDEERRESFVELLLGACAQTKSALVFVSHDRRLAPRFSGELSLPAINRAANQADSEIGIQSGTARTTATR